jgi:hypothetical protein
LLRIYANTAIDVYAGVDASRKVLLAIGVAQVPPDIDVGSAAIEYFRHQRKGGGWIMALRLRAPVLRNVFSALCRDLADEVALISDHGIAVQILKKRLLQWARLFKEGQNGLLSASEVRGLFAELAVLQRLVQKRGADAAVAAWQGPLRADQDFIFDDLAYEVKAVQEQARFVSISSLQQLDGPRPIELCVLTVSTVSAPPMPERSLNAQVAKLQGELSASSTALTMFREKLLDAGYVELEEYGNTFHTVESSVVFSVSGNFPRLVPAVVPGAIHAATYSLSLADLQPFTNSRSLISAGQ